MSESQNAEPRNYFEDLDEVVKRVRAQAVGLTVKPGEPGQPAKPLPQEEQERLVGTFIHAASEGLTDQGESYYLLGKVFPLTRQGRKVNFLERTGWNRDSAAEAQAQLDRPRKGDDPDKVCMLPRAPGGEYVPLSAEKVLTPWEKGLEMWILDNLTRPEGMKVTRDSIEKLGEEIAAVYNRSPDDILLDISGKPDSYDLTYHYEAIVPGKTPHSCGAHGNDTLRGMMAMLVQGALLAYATKDFRKKKNIVILGRRTAANGDPAELIDPSKVDFQTFAAHFFAGGQVPADPKSIDAALRQGGRLYQGSPDDRPSLETLYEILREANIALKASEERGLVAMYPCSDDRNTTRITKDKRVILGQSSKHVSNILFFSLGSDAATRGLVNTETDVLEDRDNPPGVYRDTLVIGCDYPGYKVVAKLKQQLIEHAKMLVQGVMSAEDRTKEIYLLVDIGEEPPDIRNPYTKEICDDEEVRSKAGILLKDWPTNMLTTDQIQKIILAHEEMTFDAIDTLFSSDLRKALKKQGLGPGPRNLEIYYKFVRHSDQTVQTRFFGVSTRQ